jgi:hypothetical protein
MVTIKEKVTAPAVSNQFALQSIPNIIELNKPAILAGMAF